MITINCIVCGKKINVSPSHPKKFCSLICRKKARTEIYNPKTGKRSARIAKLTFNCKFCGREYHPFRKSLGYCSRICWHQRNSLEKTKQCIKCKKILPKRNFWFRSNRRFGARMSECKKCQSERAKKWREKNPNEAKNREIQRSYGISLKDYLEMKEKQQLLCAICKKKEILVIDHNHKNGIVRGLLCQSCNHLLGNAKEDISILKKAILYLNEQKISKM